MKKLALVLLIICLSTSLLAGCKPSNIDQKTYDLGKEAVKITENYLSGKTSASDAYRNLKSIHRQLESYVPTHSSSHRQVTTWVLIICNEFELPLITGKPIDDASIKKDLANLKSSLR